MKEHKRQQRNTASGSTFLELTAAMAVISLALLSFAGVAAQNIQAKSVKEHILTAAMLSQEGLELVRAHRDRNVFGTPSNPPHDGIGISGGDRSYSIRYSGEVNYGPNTDTDSGARLFRDSAAGFYTDVATGNINTPYTRLIRVVEGANYLAASSTVTRQDRGVRRRYVAETVFYDWW